MLVARRLLVLSAVLPHWLPTDPARKFELMARFYAPKKEFFEKKWILPDVEKVAAQ